VASVVIFNHNTIHSRNVGERVRTKVEIASSYVRSVVTPVLRMIVSDGQAKKVAVEGCCGNARSFKSNYRPLITDLHNMCGTLLHDSRGDENYGLIHESRGYRKVALFCQCQRRELLLTIHHKVCF
jgi:hypothetical protein